MQPGHERLIIKALMTLAQGCLRSNNIYRTT